MNEASKALELLDRLLSISITLPDDRTTTTATELRQTIEAQQQELEAARAVMQEVYDRLYTKAGEKHGYTKTIGQVLLESLQATEGEA